MTDKIIIDVGAVAKRAREIALETAKSNPAIQVGPESGFVVTTLDFLCVREALREFEPNLVDQIFNKLKDKIEQDMKSEA
jgi:hypothetical protein